MSLADSKEWLEQAEHDLAFARQLIKVTPDWACFAAQQAAEKAIKAVRVALGAEVEDLRVVKSKQKPPAAAPGHDLSALFGPVLGLLPRPDPSVAQSLILLTDHERSARYPGVRGGAGRAPFRTYSESQAQRAVDSATAVANLCRRLHDALSALWQSL